MTTLELTLTVNRWNNQHRPGMRVTYRKDFGELVATRTRTPAAVLGGHTAVVWLEGYAACVALDRVTAIGASRGACAQ